MGPGYDDEDYRQGFYGFTTRSINYLSTLKQGSARLEVQSLEIR
jgi:hypothetical protein